MQAMPAAATDCIGPRQAGARLRFFDTLSRRATSENAGEESGPVCPDREVQKRAREVPGNGESGVSPRMSTTVAGRLRQTDRLADEPTGCRTAGREDDERNVDFLAIQTSTVAEQSVLAQLFAVIRSDDDQSVVEQASVLELIDQAPIWSSR